MESFNDAPNRALRDPARTGADLLMDSPPTRLQNLLAAEGTKPEDHEWGINFYRPVAPFRGD